MNNPLMAGGGALRTSNGKQRGTLVLSNPTGNVSFTIAGVIPIPDNALETSDGKIFKTSDNKYFIVANS